MKILELLKFYKIEWKIFADVLIWSSMVWLKRSMHVPQLKMVLLNYRVIQLRHQSQIPGHHVILYDLQQELILLNEGFFIRQIFLLFLFCWFICVCMREKKIGL
jgi:hypothetical protein